MKIKLELCDAIDDWYAIVRAEHDGKTWFEQTGSYSSRFMMSERLSPEASIEGRAYEMRAVARAIKNRTYAEFKRVAVYVCSDGVHLSSPKNSDGDVVVTLEEAEELADQIIRELGEEV